MAILLAISSALLLFLWIILYQLKKKVDNHVAEQKAINERNDRETLELLVTSCVSLLTTKSRETIKEEIDQYFKEQTT